MKVMLINGSSHANGCTALALRQAATALEEEGIETETLFIGSAPLAAPPATAAQRRTSACSTILSMKLPKRPPPATASSSAPRCITRILPPDCRLCWIGRSIPAGRASPSSPVRRWSAPGAPALRLPSTLSISNMPVVSSTYWNNIHGNAQSEAEQDAEGLMTMRNLGKNMAWLLKCIEAGKAQGLEHPAPTKIATNFIR